MTYSITEIEKLLEGTTEGDWKIKPGKDGEKDVVYRGALGTDGSWRICIVDDYPNATFIAASKEIIKQLLKERAAYRHMNIQLMKKFSQPGRVVIFSDPNGLRGGCNVSNSGRLSNKRLRNLFAEGKTMRNRM